MVTEAVMGVSGRRSAAEVAVLPLRASDDDIRVLPETPRNGLWHDTLFLSHASIRLTEPLAEPDIRERVVRLPIPYLADWCAVHLVGVTETANRTADLAPVVVCAHVDHDQEPRARMIWQRAVQVAPRSVPPLVRMLRGDVGTVPPTIIDVVPEPMSHRPPNKLAAQLMAQVGLATAMYLILVADGRAIGVLTLGSVTPGRYGPREVALAVEYANRAATVLDRAQQYGRVVALLRARDTTVLEIAHDLQVSTAQMARYAEDLHERLATSKTPQHDSQALRTCSHIEETTRSLNDVLDDFVSTCSWRVGAETAPIRQQMDLVALARQAVEQYGELAPGHTIRFDAGGLDHVVGNWKPGILKRMLDNLLSNAVTFSQPDGAITVHVWRGQARADLRTRPREWVFLQVRDEGFGIPASDLPHIFKLFYRGRNVRQTLPGTGVGLSSVMSLVQRYGGTVRVASELGEGTSVTIMLPLDPPPRPAQTNGRTRRRVDVPRRADSVSHVQL